jgi:ElaB/YqjD/DUF883 family membrane-anchored ribosome-binding protein
MAEEIRVTTAEDVEFRTEAAPARRNVETTSSDPEVVRDEIEHTRARMSETIDEIEEQLLRKKEAIQDRLDVFGVVRERPMQALGVVFGAGLLLGLVTGGDDDEEEEETGGHHRAGFDMDGAERSDTWEHRARRLLHIAQEQEAELERLRMRRGQLDSRAGMDHHDHGSGTSMFDKLQDTAAERISDFVRESFQRVLRGGL